jgi:transitional endoplasmic reticulum ATPase
MADTEPLVPKQSAFNAYFSHSSGQRIHTDTVIQRVLLDQYPNHCLTVTNCNLIKYAKAGHATIRLAGNEVPHIFHRDYEATIGELDDEYPSGMLKSTTIFACYNFDWRGHSLLVYVVEGQDAPMTRRCEPRSYILTKPSSELPIEHLNDTIADSLIRAAGIWEERSDNEVWVYDRGSWVKDRELWLNVQHASHDDLILPRDMRTALQRDILGFFDAKQHYREIGIPWKVCFEATLF